MCSSDLFLFLVQQKMEKSFLTFQATYPTWEPDTSGRNMLNSLNGFSNTNESALGKSADLSASVLKRSFHNLKDVPTSSKGDVRHRFDRGSSHRPPAHGSGSMFHPSFISDTQELHTLRSFRTLFGYPANQLKLLFQRPPNYCYL